MAEIYSRSSAVRPLDNKLRMKPKGQFFLREIGAKVWEKGGDYESFERVPQIDEEDITSNEFPERQLVGIDITRADFDILFTARMATEILTRVGFLSKKLTYAQEAVADGEITETCGPDQLIELGKLDCTVTSVKGPNDETYVLGVNYEFDAPSGFVGVLKHPDGVVPDAKGAAAVTVAYTAPAITGRTSYAIMSDTQILVAVAFRGKVKFGRQQLQKFGLVQLRPDGNVPMGGDGESFATMGFIGRVLVDPNRPGDYQLGEAIDLPRA